MILRIARDFHGSVLRIRSAPVLLVEGLAPYRLSGQGRPGLIFGCAALGERAIGEGVELLAEALRR
jgi:hypothetical protein